MKKSAEFAEKEKEKVVFSLAEVGESSFRTQWRTPFCTG
jgi:hypothetical protein